MLRLIGLYGGHISFLTVIVLKGGGTLAAIVAFDYAGVGLMLGEFLVGCIWLYYVHINEHKGLTTAYVQGLWLQLS